MKKLFALGMLLFFCLFFVGCSSRSVTKNRPLTHLLTHIILQWAERLKKSREKIKS